MNFQVIFDNALLMGGPQLEKGFIDTDTFDMSFIVGFSQ